MSETVNRTASRRARLKVLGWVAIASLLALVTLGPTVGGASAVTAVTSLHQTPPITWSATGYEDEDCGTVAAGSVLWHFVLVQTSAAVAGSQLHATFASGDVTVDAYKKSGGVLHFNITTGQTTLLGAHTNRAGTWLNLSHICVGPPVTTTTTSSTTTTTSATSTTTTVSTTATGSS